MPRVMPRSGGSASLLQGEVWTSLKGEGKTQSAKMVPLVLDRKMGMARLFVSLDLFGRMRQNKSQKRDFFWWINAYGALAPIHSLVVHMWAMPLWFWREETDTLSCPPKREKWDTPALRDGGTEASWPLLISEAALWPRSEAAGDSGSIRWPHVPR